MRTKMLSSEWDTGDSEWDNLGESGDGGVRVMYMNVGKGVVATHEYL